MVHASAVTSVVAEIVRLSAAIGAAYLTVGLVLVMAETQVGLLSGTPQALARVTERIILIAFCLAVVVSAPDLGGQVAGMVSGAMDGGGAVAVWQALAGLVVRILILSAGALLTLSVTAGSLAAQLAAILGQPNARAVAVTRLGLAVVVGVLTLVSVQMAKLILSSVLQ
jgi:hypothetical protein